MPERRPPPTSKAWAKKSAPPCRRSMALRSSGRSSASDGRGVVALFEWTLVLLFAAVVLTAFSRRIGAPYPSLLALAGAAIAFLPSSPEITIDPEFALALFVAPILTDTGFDT